MKTNNKTLTYILLAVVGFIWFKVFVRLKDNAEVETVQYTANHQGFTGKISKPESFHLKANYNDPFKIRKVAVNNPVSVDPNNLPPKPVKEKPAPKVVYWPPIKYFGFVKNNTPGRTPRALVAFENTIYKLRKNEVFLDGFEIKSLSRDEMVMKYKGEVRTFYKMR